jgi:hypothetical protein
MKNFIEPIQGTKIAEFKLSWFKDYRKFEGEGYSIFGGLLGLFLLLSPSLFWWIRLIGILALIISIYFLIYFIYLTISISKIEYSIVRMMEL